MRILIPILFLTLLLGCGGSENSNPVTDKPVMDTIAQQQPTTDRKPDTSTWFSTEKTAALESKIGVTGYVDRAKAIEEKVPQMEVTHQSCKLWYGPGTLSIFRLEGKVAKLRVDWAVETAHSHIEYFFENNKMFLMDFNSRDFGNNPEAEQSYNFQTPDVVKHVLGRYYLDNEKVNKGIMATWLAGEEEPPYTLAPIDAEGAQNLNTYFENDMNNMRLVFEGKMKCAELAEAGYFP